MAKPVPFIEMSRRLKAKEILRGKDAGDVSGALHEMTLASIDVANRTATYVLTEEVADLGGERMSVDGGETADYLRNPVFLWMHPLLRAFQHQGRLEMPIGKMVRIWKDKGQMLGLVQYMTADEDAGGDLKHSFAEKCWQMVCKGYLSAVSIFFKTLDAVWNEDRQGVDITHWKLLEVSQVTVGELPSALLVGKSLNAEEADDQQFLLAAGFRAKALNESSSSEGGSTMTPDELSKTLEGHCKSLQDLHSNHAKMIGDHAKSIAGSIDLQSKCAKSLADANAHTEKLGALFDDLSEILNNGDPEEEGENNGGANSKAAQAGEIHTKADALWLEAEKLEATDKAKATQIKAEVMALHAKAATIIGGNAKAGAVLSGKNFGRIKAASKHLQAVMADHKKKGGADAEPAEDPPDKKSVTEPAAPDFEEWFRSQTPEQLKATAGELAEAELKRVRGAA